MDVRRIDPTMSSNQALTSRPCVREVAWRCSFCMKTILELDLFAAAPDGAGTATWQQREPAGRRMIWPVRSPRSLDESVPEKIRGLYEEASRSELAGALRNAAGGYRATVEEICEDQKAPPGTLYHRIEALAQAGLDQDIADAMHEARALGNYSLHDGLEFSSDEVEDVAELIDEIVYTLYVVPADRFAMKQARQRRRDGK
jgi:Domain of unknown function (DUF4145)